MSVAPKLRNREAIDALGRMTPVERRLFQDGFVSRFIDTVSEVGDRRNVLNQIAASPAARQRLMIALGPQGAAQLEAGLRVEGIMDLARGAVQGNSTTARQLAELGLAGGMDAGRAARGLTATQIAVDASCENALEVNSQCVCRRRRGRRLCRAAPGAID